MDTLKAMQVFVEVAKQNGFAPAAKSLELSTSSVSRHITNLESRLNRQLFKRSTRHLALTQAGSDLLDRCRRIVDETADLFQRISDESPAPAGRLKITMPQFLATLLAKDVISRYILDHPAISLELVELNRIVNLIDEDFDLAIRVGELPDSSLIGRKLVDMELVLVAAPAYIDTHGEPRSIAELRAHHCIVETESPYKDRWPLVNKGSTRHYQVKASVRVNNGERARDLAAGCSGIALLPIYMVLEELASGQLLRVLEESTPTFGGIYAVYPNTRFHSNNVRSFIDYLVEYFRAIRMPA
jgi:DNA-binding transcriptional LysR family regulator